MGRGGDNGAAGIFYGRNPLRSARPESEPRPPQTICQQLAAAGLAQMIVSYSADDVRHQITGINYLTSEDGGRRLIPASELDYDFAVISALRDQGGRLLERALDARGQDWRQGSVGEMTIDADESELVFEHYLLEEHGYHKAFFQLSAAEAMGL